MIEASLNAIHLTISNLITTSRHEVREDSSHNAIEIGLVGVSAELAMSACLIHAHGSSIQLKESGNYKSFPEILSDFKNLVREARPISDFLIDGVSNPALHRQELESRILNFKILSTVRAGGLHAGKGPTKEAAIHQAKEVILFLSCLSKSNKIKPYLEILPNVDYLNYDRTLILDDLSRRLSSTSSNGLESTISSVFLVLPDIPQDHPDWLEVFNKVTIAPKDRDISYLLNVLDTVVPATLRRNTQSGEAIPVRVDPENPSALPIAPSYLRRQFNQRRDQLMADLATANGRLNDNYLDLPPPESVREMFAIGIHQSGILGENDHLTAHESWPFLTSSLRVQGTNGPYWFLIRSTNDLGQLNALLNRANDIGGPRLNNSIEECFEGIRAMREQIVIQTENQYFEGLLNDLNNSESLRASLLDNYNRHINNDRSLPEDYKIDLEEIIDGSSTEGLISKLKDSDLSLVKRNYWLRVLAEVSIDLNDTAPLVEILNNNDLINTHTSVKKALRRIDFRLFGPPISPAV